MEHLPHVPFAVVIVLMALRPADLIRERTSERV